MATEADNVNSGALGTLLTVGAFATLGIALVVTALVRAEMSEEAEKKDVSADRPFRDLMSEQRAKLDAPAAYVDRSKGLVSLPLERAMELTVEGLKKDPSSATPPAPPTAGAGGSGAATAAVGGAGGTGGAAPAAPAADEAKDKDKDKEKGDKEKKAPKKAPAPPAPVPAAPAPAAPTPPAPAPNGQ